MGAVAAGQISGLKCCSESLGELKALKNEVKKIKAAAETSGRLRGGEAGTKPQQNKLMNKVFSLQQSEHREGSSSLDRLKLMGLSFAKEELEVSAVLPFPRGRQS